MAVVELLILTTVVAVAIYLTLRPLRSYLERRIAEGLRRKNMRGRIIDVEAEPPQSKKKE